MTLSPGGGWPVTEANASWLHQSANDAFFTWMRGVRVWPVVGYEPATATLKTYSNLSYVPVAPKIDRGGRYIATALNIPQQNGAIFWDWLTDTVVWIAPSDPTSLPFAHTASLNRQYLGVAWNDSYPCPFSQFKPDVANSGVRLAGGPATGALIYVNGNWIQNPVNPNDQWAVSCNYGSIVPETTWVWLAPGGLVMLTANGQRRLVGHHYNTSSNYSDYPFPKLSPDGAYVMFTSNMNGSGRVDTFVAELPGAVVLPPAPTPVPIPVPVTYSLQVVDSTGKVIGKVGLA